MPLNKETNQPAAEYILSIKINILSNIATYSHKDILHTQNIN